MKNNHASDWQPGTLKTPSEYSRRAFYALSRHFPSTFWIPKKNENYRGVHDALRRCTFIHYLHMLIVPCQYLLWTLLVPKVATGPDNLPVFLFHWSLCFSFGNAQFRLLAHKTGRTRRFYVLSSEWCCPCCSCRCLSFQSGPCAVHLGSHSFLKRFMYRLAKQDTHFARELLFICTVHIAYRPF